MRCGRLTKTKLTLLWDEELRNSHWAHLITEGIEPPLCTDCLTALDQISMEELETFFGAARD